MSYTVTDTCVGCSACEKVCPVYAIEGVLSQMFHINEKRCISCGVCARVCPQSAIMDEDGNFPPIIPRRKWKIPVVDHSLCSLCNMCVDVCARGALSLVPLEMDEVHVDSIHIDRVTIPNPKVCVGCGLCAQTCPMGAIQMGER